ncbi:hypothetical protein AAT19DRAFT_9833 [Rhodotorula toruloides]|uniref:Uncharacterized protein n=1 Tax=Rhodotorula toruloides TaxID=5286 RepID=A0A2T0A123_RHOTO|nr:hypothetical protein AAT19DRAFT_9833 [Rhodotorula toruloides]
MYGGTRDMRTSRGQRRRASETRRGKSAFCGRTTRRRSYRVCGVFDDVLATLNDSWT